MTRISPGHNASVGPGTHFPWDARSDPAVGDLLQVEAQAGPEGTTVLRVSGEIDLATSPLLRRRALSQLAQAQRRLVLDLRGVGFLGSAGLAVLVEIRSEALRRDIDLRLITTSRAVLRPLIATGLIELFDVDAGEPPEHPPRQGR